MIRSYLTKTGAVTSAYLFPTGWFPDHDKISNETKTEKLADRSVLAQETGWDRLERMYLPDEFGELSKELTTIIHVGAMSLFVGALYGGVLHSRTAYMDFIKNNQATAFHDHLEAKKKLQDKVTLSFGKGALRWSWRLSLFSTAFVGISTTISVYRGTSGILEYVFAGMISGATYKFQMGPKGWVVGGTVGAALGLVCGGITMGLLKMTGMSMDEVRYWQYHWQQSRQQYLVEGMKKYKAKEEGELFLFHDEKLGEDGKKIENIDKEKSK